jgi:hypothetical protein
MSDIEKSVDRFGVQFYDGQEWLMPTVNGGFVRYADYAALAAERDKLAGQLAEAVEALQYISNGDDPYEPCGWAIHTASATLSRITGETP